MVLEKTLENPLDCKEIQPVNPKGNQPWTFIGRSDAEAEAPILWPPDAKSWLIGKDPDAGKDWGQVEKGVRVDEIQRKEGQKSKVIEIKNLETKNGPESYLYPLFPHFKLDTNKGTLTNFIQSKNICCIFIL